MRLNFFMGLLPLLLIIGGTLGYTQFGEFDSDTVEITASADPDDELPSHASNYHGHGSRRQNRELPVPDPDPDSEDPSASTRAKISISCTTARNEEGVCKLFKECYPLFFLRDSERRRREILIPAIEQWGSYLELEKIYRNVSGPCDKDVLDAISSINIGKGVSTSTNEYVCCPNDKKKPANPPSRPPATTTPKPEVVPEGGSGGGGGESHCGKSFVTWKADEDEGEPNVNVTDSEGVVPRIVNGRRAAKGEFPYAVALMNNGVQFCGGSLISNEHVLTAAHCIYYMNQNDVTKLRINIGDHDVYSTSDGPHEERSASNIYYHKGFTMSTLYDDISVIRLSKPVTFGKHIQPVCLHTGSPPYDTGTTSADVIGWGQVANKGPPSNILNTVQVRVITPKECIKAYGKKAPAGITAGMVCAGGQGRDSCRGDSGGPLTIRSGSKTMQIGVVSWGIGCATFPGVYTRVDRYSAWIQKNQR